MPPRGRNGVYELGSHPEDFTPYNGRNRADTVFVVGHNTPYETLFKKRDARKAVAYSRTHTPPLSIFQAAVTSICSAAIEALYDA